MHIGLPKRGSHRFLNAALLCLMLVVALHHVMPHAGSFVHSDGRCELCVLLSAALIAPLATVALVAPARRTFLRVLPQLPPLGTETWNSWSHRGPPSLFS